MRVTPPDLEAWFTDYIRAALAAAGHNVQVGNKEPGNLGLPLGRPLVVVRDDSGPREDWTLFDRSLGFTILAGTRQLDKPANDLARLVAAIVQDTDLPTIPGSPVAAVRIDGCLGPYAVPESLDVARRYLTGQYTVTGTW